MKKMYCENERLNRLLTSLTISIFHLLCGVAVAQLSCGKLQHCVIVLSILNDFPRETLEMINLHLTMSITQKAWINTQF